MCEVSLRKGGAEWIMGKVSSVCGSWTAACVASQSQGIQGVCHEYLKRAGGGVDPWNGALGPWLVGCGVWDELERGNPGSVK